MTLTTPSPLKNKLPKATKVPAIIITIQAMFDQFGLLEKYKKKYGDIFYTPKSSLLPPYVIFSDPKGIEQVSYFAFKLGIIKSKEKAVILIFSDF